MTFWIGFGVGFLISPAAIMIAIAGFDEIVARRTQGCSTVRATSSTAEATVNRSKLHGDEHCRAAL